MFNEIENKKTVFAYPTKFIGISVQVELYDDKVLYWLVSDNSIEKRMEKYPTEEDILKFRNEILNPLNLNEMFKWIPQFCKVL